MSSKTEFASKIGLIAATVGSAVGLGNVWRFPAETQANGGAAFLLIYILCVLILGVPVMLSEFALGRSGRSDSIGVFRKLSPGKLWWVVGSLAVLASYIIMSYYMVVAGWTLEYLFESITGGLYSNIGMNLEGDISGLRSQFSGKMNEYICNDWRPLTFTYAMIVINAVILIGGVQKGIERLSNILMPLLFVILLGMCAFTLTLPNASEGLLYFLSPDFSKITPDVIINALGQAFFSLSLGMGILITYASYYPESTKLAQTSIIVAILSVVVAVLMGMTIFPAVKSFGLDKETLEGATLVFVTLPEVFAQLPAPQLWSTMFFILLLVAALTSTVSIAEVSVAMLCDRFSLRRPLAVLSVLTPLFVISAVCSLSFGSLSDFTVFGKTVFDFLDYFSTDWLLPVVALGVCLYMGWFAPKGLLKNELSNNGSLRNSGRSLIVSLIRYVAPVLILVIMIYPWLSHGN